MIAEDGTAASDYHYLLTLSPPGLATAEFTLLSYIRPVLILATMRFLCLHGKWTDAKVSTLPCSRNPLSYTVLYLCFVLFVIRCLKTRLVCTVI